MGTLTANYTENFYTTNKSTWTTVYTTNDVTASGSTVTLVRPTVTAKYSAVGTKTHADALIWGKYYLNNTALHSKNFTWKQGTVAWTANSNKTLPVESASYSEASSISVNTSTLFTSSNNTSKTVNILFKPNYITFNTWQSSGSALNSINGYSSSTEHSIGSLVTVTLNAPPIIDSTHNTATLSYSPANVGIYTSVSTISVSVGSLAAQYGGTITKVTLQIGNQSVEKTSDFTSPITLVPESVPTADGKVIPRVIFTDSRGQTNYRDLAEITILPYECIVSNSNAIRTNAQFIKDDEATNAVISATFKHSHFSGSYLTKPIVNYSESTSTTTTIITNNITWYQDWSATTGVFSNEITTNNWQTLSAEILLYGKINNITFDKNKSYTINIIPTTSMKSGGGPAKATILSQSFYLLAGRPGGHGLGIGVKPATDALYVGMDATFSEDLIAQDMTSSEIQDFVDNLESGGGNGTVDRVIEQGTSSIWTYRKWSSGIAECWGCQDIPSTTYSANGGYRAVSAGLPSGLFINTPNIVIACGRISGLIQTDIGFTSPNDANTIQTYLINRAGSATTQAGQVYWNVKGRWK